MSLFPLSPAVKKRYFPSRDTNGTPASIQDQSPAARSNSRPACERDTQSALELLRRRPRRDDQIALIGRNEGIHVLTPPPIGGPFAPASDTFHRPTGRPRRMPWPARPRCPSCYRPVRRGGDVHGFCRIERRARILGRAPSIAFTLDVQNVHRRAGLPRHRFAGGEVQLLPSGVTIGSNENPFSTNGAISGFVHTPSRSLVTMTTAD